MVNTFSSLSVVSRSHGLAIGLASAHAGVHVERLLNNFREMFKVDDAFIANLHKRLCTPGRFFVLEVDMDQVPKFYQRTSVDMISRMATSVFVIGSANRAADRSALASKGNFHFTLAMKTKDAADAVLTMAMSKMDSIIVACGRQKDVYHMMVSDDRIFEQATQLMRQGGSPAMNVSRAQAQAGLGVLSRQLVTWDWKCDVCGKTFGSERALEQHQEDTHTCSSSSSCSDDQDWECYSCGKTFGSERALEQHQEATFH
jgi:hypothetical protein